MIFEYTILSTDENLPVVQRLSVGLRTSYGLEIRIRHSDHDKPEYTCHTSALVRSSDAIWLARQLGVGVSELPHEICDFMSEIYGGIINPRPSDISDCFADIIERLLDHGCHLRIERGHGARGFICA
ncbi:MAG: hypothetical protein K2L27_00630 [Muribaculaceae bacterium]|nr:hypothetical protein [Muribaculaceae bacterium]